MNPAALGLIGAGSKLLGGLIGSKGVKSQNEANRQMAREQMRFQERMSSTAYQRSADDLEKAGLNRILALGSPASTPGGASAVMQNVSAPLASAVADAPNSAQSMIAKREAIKQTRQTTKNLARQEDLIWAQTEAAIAAAMQSNSAANVSMADAVIRRLMADMYAQDPELLYLRELGGPVASGAGILRLFGGKGPKGLKGLKSGKK